MKMRLWSMLFVICCAAYVEKVAANPVTRQQARKNVQAFLEKRGQKVQTLVMDDQSNTSDNESFYIFNIGINQGYVIAAGDDCVPGILGYSSEGTLIKEAIPDNMKAWLQGYADQIAYMKEHHLSYRGDGKTDHAIISPLLTTTWGQDDPYNQQCPDFFSYGKSVTGCVATAMAQVMYYHRANSTDRTLAEIPGYSCRTNWSGLGQIAVSAVPSGSVIDWDNMIDRYRGVSSTEAQQKAVADLMAYCGASVEMNYGNGPNGGSGAASERVPVALKKYFGYSISTMLEKRANYTDKEWDDLVYHELSMGNPVYYSGSNNSGGGHAFVCDGYDGDGYYHINWGWEGLSDGNFLLSVLDPDVQGTGGSDAGYNLDQDALIGAVPKDLSVVEHEAYVLFENGVLTFYCDDDRSTRGGTTYDLDTGNGFPEWIFEYNAESNSYSPSKASNITKVVFDRSFSSATPTTTKWWFSYCSNLTEIEGLNYLNTKYVEDMSYMFAFCTQLSDFDLDNFDTSNVSDFQNMFIYCYGLQKLDISHFVTRRTWTMFHMFRNCSNLTEIILPADLKMISNSQFKDCTNLTAISLPGSITEIDENAFMNSGLKTVISHMETPCSIDETVFSGINANAILYVPLGSRSAYMAADHWKSFYAIAEMDPDLDVEVELNDVFMNAGDQAVMTSTQFENLILAKLNGNQGMSRADFLLNYQLLDEGKHENMPDNDNGALYETAATNHFWAQRFYMENDGTLSLAANYDNEYEAANSFDYTKWTADNNWFGRIWFNPAESADMLIWDLHGYTEKTENSSATYAGNMKDAPDIPYLYDKLMEVAGVSYESKGLNTKAVSTIVRFINKTIGNVVNVKLFIPAGKMHFEYGEIANKDWSRWYQFDSDEAGAEDNTPPYWKEFDVHINVTSYSQLLTDYWATPSLLSVLSGDKTKFSKFYSETEGADPTYVYSFTTPQKDVNSSISAINGQWVAEGASGVKWTLQLAAHNGVENTAVVAVMKDNEPYGPEEICYLDDQLLKSEQVVVSNTRIHYHGLESNDALYPAATDLLNNEGAFTAYLKIETVHDLCYNPLIGKNLFNIRFHRPINVIAKSVNLEEQATDEGLIPVKDLVEVVDWNHLPVIAAGTETADANESLPFEYYGISELAVRYDEIRTDYAKSGIVRANTYSSLKDIVDHTDLVKDVSTLSTIGDSELRPVSLLHADGTTVSFTDAHAYNHSDLNVSGNGTNFGWLYCNEKTDETQVYHIYVPVAVKYNWGNIAYDYISDANGQKLDKDYTQTVWAVVTVNADKITYMMGDANGDGNVDVLDVVAVVDYILERPVSTFIIAVADVNGDQKIDVIDVVGVVDIILGRNTTAEARQVNDTDNDMVSMKLLDDNSLSLCLTNQSPYMAAQFDLKLADGQSIDWIKLQESRARSHQMAYSKVGKDTYRVMIYSLDASSFIGQDGELLRIKLNNSADHVEVNNIKFITSRNGIKVFSPLWSDATGINTTKDVPVFDIYSIDGQLVRKQTATTQGLKKGLYVINRQKIAIK